MNILFKEKKNKFISSVITKLEGGKGAKNEDVPGKMFTELPFPALFYIASGKRSHRA